jgi:hypothetical protein
MWTERDPEDFAADLEARAAREIRRGNYDFAALLDGAANWLLKLTEEVRDERSG